MYCGKELLKIVKLFNVGEAELRDGRLFLRRYPSCLDKFLSPDGADMGKQSTGCEIRFVKTEKGRVRVNLSVENEGSHVLVYRGDRLDSGYPISHNCSIIINDNPCDSVKNPDFFNADNFSKDVIRLVIQGGYVAVDSIETYGRKIRPPHNDEEPQKTILAYGSSITHGARSGNTQLTYASFAGQLLGAQVMNKGLAGSCLCENEIADYFAENIKYDAFIFELGTNMYSYCLSKNYDIEATADFIKKRGEYMLSKMLDKNPDKPIFLITPLRPHTKYDSSFDYETIENVIVKMQESIERNSCFIIKAEEIQPTTSVVTTDLIHPSPEGHVIMGFKLAELIRKHL